MFEALLQTFKTTPSMPAFGWGQSSYDNNINNVGQQ